MARHPQQQADSGTGANGTKTGIASNDLNKNKLLRLRPRPERSARRGPYVQQACYACRKRKGRCDGSQPCSYCENRNCECVYSDPGAQLPITRRHFPEAQDVFNTSVFGSSSRSILSNIPTTQGQEPMLTGAVPGDEGRISECITGKDHLQSSSSRGSIVAGGLATSAIQANCPRARSQSQHSRTDRSSTTTSSLVSNLSRRPRRRHYHGPTSPNYSFHAIRRQFTEQTRDALAPASNRTPTAQAAALELAESDSDQDSVLSVALCHPNGTPGMVTPHSHPILYQTLDVLGKHECTRLLRVYDQALGELHPICSTDELKDEACRLQGSNLSTNVSQDVGNHDPFEAEENELLILNLALAIAMTAEAASDSGPATIIYENCRDLVMSKVARTASCVKDVVVVMMMGFYYFFRGKRRLAWRMCGLAGRMAMELGIHSHNHSRHHHETEEQEHQLAVLSCTILIVDRQWSAGTGLPSNFKETDFDLAKIDRASTNYLTEMMKFTLISHKFNEPISQVARGEVLDQANIEIVEFQVEQWRKRALESRNYVHPEKWDGLPRELLPPPWMTILYLRANAVRIILIRPFFLSDSDSHVAAEKVGPGLDLVSDSLNVLSILDQTTDAYRMLHPNFQHFVASSCALLLLLIIFMKQNGEALPTESAATYSHLVQRNFEIALKLSAAYQHLSLESRKLWQYLQTIGEPLFSWGILQEPTLREYNTRPHSSGQATHKDQSRPEKRDAAAHPQMQPEEGETSTDDWALQRQIQKTHRLEYDGTSQHGLDGPQHPTSGDWDLDEFAPLIAGWPMGGEGAFFSDGIHILTQ